MATAPSQATVDSTTIKAFGPQFEPAFGPGFKTTADLLNDQLVSNSRPNNPMEQVQPWECRVGGSKFFVPPINIRVAQTFRASDRGGAIRQQTPVRFNTGHSETIIAMTLYFPTDDTIWGFDGSTLTINFDNESDAVIDRYMSSLRGLVTQFKYSPILPIKNAYLNGAHGIDAVALQSLTVSSLENFPFVLVAELQMVKFNYKVFLPMVSDFDNAIHWGRFRQYIGRAAQKLQEISSKDFLQDPNPQAPGSASDLSNATSFDKALDFAQGHSIELYYPDHDPARAIAPDLTYWKADKTQTSGGESWWSNVTKYLGLSPQSPLGAYANVQAYPGAANLLSEYRLLDAWLTRTATPVSAMNSSNMKEYVSSRQQGRSQQDKDLIAHDAQAAWLGRVYQGFLNDPYLSKVFAFQQFLRGSIQIQEWDVPMRKLGIDNPNVIVHGVNVQVRNNIIPLQLSLQGEPTYQHIGGLGETAEINMTVVGEEDLGSIRLMFDIINGLGRLEHGHAVLGFLGIKNVITSLMGMKYAIPANFEVDVIPNQPHVYNVKLTLMDFDVFQQKREMLSSEQQQEFVEAFSSKKNPFLRIQQLWGAFNAYPDFPLSVRDNGGKIIGQLDPDYYFKAYKSIDDDIANYRQTKQAKLSAKDQQAQALNNLEKQSTARGPAARNPQDYDVIHHLSNLSEGGAPQGIAVHSGGFDLLNNNAPVAQNCSINEPHPGNTLTTPTVPGCTPAAAYSHPYSDRGNNPDGQFDAMMADAQYRDQSGRMIRAFPTYMMWLIDEGGKIFGQRAFDNFYGLQSVLDIAVARSEDNLGDTAVIKISNLYSRLSTEYRDLIDPAYFPYIANVVNHSLNFQRNTLSGFTNYIVRLENVKLQPGVRLHLRMGYSANPNKLETVFNGTITQVEQGDVITVTAQSDAIEFSAVVNNKNENADTGKIDGSLLGGMWLSEPRDLMTRLMSDAGSGFRELVLHLTHGMIYSENRFGIRHFGSILYEPMTDTEKGLTSARADFLTAGTSNLTKFFEGTSAIGSPARLLNAGVGNLLNGAWVNFHRKRDYELYRRNIYPGNGTGVSQYMGGDLGDGGVAQVFGPVGINNQDPGATPPDPRTVLDAAKNDIAKSNQVQKTGSSAQQQHPIMGMLHLTSPEGLEDDLKGFQEVSFRATTYMKSVWDLFLECAALLPNYIVAVRPFMDRSTVFYGKPHWMYTSGVIPLSKGAPQAGGTPLRQPNEDDLSQTIRNIEKARNTKDDFYDKLSALSDKGWDMNQADPSGSTNGLPYTGAGGSGAISYADAEGYWIAAGGDTDKAAYMAAVAVRESGLQPGAIQQGQPYSTTGWGLWQITPGNSVPTAGIDFELLDPLTNAKAAVTKYNAAKKAWGDGTRPWTTRNAARPQSGVTPTNVTGDPGQFAPVGNAPSGTHNSSMVGGKTQGVIPIPMVGNVPATQDNITRIQGVNANVPEWMKDHPDRIQATPNPEQYSIRWGFEQSDVPVDFKKFGSVVDTVGEGAHQVYGGQRSDEQADAIWKEFRDHFGKDESTHKTFDAHYPTQKSRYDQIVRNFTQFMWTNAYHRGWIVQTADAQVSLGGLTTGDARQLASSAAGAVEDVPVLGALAEGAAGLFGDVSKGVSGLLNAGGPSNDWDFDRAHHLFEVYITQGDQAAIDWMKANDSPGYDNQGLIGRSVEFLKKNIWDRLWDFFNSIRKAVGSAVTGIVNLIRMSMLTLTGGLNLSAYAGRQANLLNRVFNDSIYWNAGPPGSLLYYADNPFTREYGEPVAEIRQPFQRMHHIDSFSHILSNGIIENQDDVYTVVTATSNKKHPVTVYFDKSAPAEKQREKSVDTGLYWDKPGILGSIMHPSALIRDFNKHMNGSEDETSAKRVALWHLKESLKDIYQGEVVVLGNPGIRPFDLVHLDDTYERMRGMFEVEQIVHHLSPEIGFVTSITPNAIVTINDPGRWLVGSYFRRAWASHSLRKELRHSFSGNAKGSARYYAAQNMKIDDLVDRAEESLKNSQQYHGGMSQIIKDVGGMAGIGGIMMGGSVLAGPAAPVAGFLGWKAFGWVRDHLLDAHGCYIEYLTKHGSPMDAGLSFNHGVAVGQVHAYSLLGDALGIAIPYKLDGSYAITMDQLLNNLGWTEEDVQQLHNQDIDMWTDNVNRQILQLSGRTTEGAPFTPPEIHYATVVGVDSGDTIVVSPAVGGSNRLRLMFVLAPTPHGLSSTDPGVLSTNYAIDKLMNEPRSLGYPPTVAIRVNPTSPHNQFGQIVGTVFHNVPAGTPPDQREAFLRAAAADWPNTTWDSYLNDGRPATFNWDLVSSGHGNIDESQIATSLPGQGVIGAGI